MSGTGIVFQRLLDEAVDGKKIFGTSFCVNYKRQMWSGNAGNLGADQPYFIASTTKLFVTALILHLRSTKSLSLNDKIVDYLPEDIVSGLNVIDGYDYSRKVTIRDLLAHTSGIPDYFQQKSAKGNSFEGTLLSGYDFGWSFEEAIEHSKKLKPGFRPGAHKKAFYSDTNFQLLGRIIEVVTGENIGALCQEFIFRRLSLANTYLYTDVFDRRPVPLYYRSVKLIVPRAMASFGPDGGGVSTSQEMMVFLEAFFNGTLFPKEYLDELKVWNPIFFPMKSGVGLHRFKLLRLFDPFGKIPELFGHSGLSGALAFCNPEKDLYITGTVNQVAYPDMSFRLMIKLIQQVLKS
jgi:D-alanyl-D-alanine carboxypeptidase